MLSLLLAQEGQMQEPYFELDATVAMFISGVIIPILVGLVTKLHASSALKAILHAFLSAVAGLIITATALDGVAVFSRESLVLAFMTWITGVAAYFGFLVPTQVSTKINLATKDVGIGPSAPDTTRIE